MKKILNIIFKYKSFFKYCIVGALGTFVDVASLYLFVTFLGINLYISVVLSFLLAVINNFLLNKFWTFRNVSNKMRRQFIKFLIVSVGGLLLTLFCMYILTDIFKIYYIISKLITSFTVLIWNFLGNKFWTFNEKPKHLFKPLDAFIFEYSVIIPAYNEENRITKTLESILNYKKNRKEKFEIIVIDDGSLDNTANSIKNNFSEIKVITYKKNRGKGYAIKRGIEEARGKYILFMDADSSTPIEEIEKIEKYKLDFDIIIGSRYLDGSNVIIKQSKLRIFISRIGNLIIQLFLVDGIVDTQCGFKMFSSNVAKEIVSFQKIERWGFDMEMLHIAEKFSYSIKEVGVNWLNDGESRLSPIKDSFRTFKELLYIKFNSWFDGYKR